MISKPWGQTVNSESGHQDEPPEFPAETRGSSGGVPGEVITDRFRPSVGNLTSPHQDDIIERILKSRDAWDPPWRQERRARGPPKAIEKQLELVPDESEFASQDDDEFNQDPPSEWWD